MKNRKRNKLLTLAVTLLSTVALLAACGGQSSEPTQLPVGDEAEYRVSVVDAKGVPYTSGVIVCFYRNGQQEAMQVVDGSGTVTRTMPTGEYTVELMFTDSDVEYVYDKTDLTLSPERTELEISLAHALGDASMEMYSGDAVLTANFVDVCCTYVPLAAGQRSYFLFAPSEAGIYQFSIIGDADSIGCYGTPYYMQSNSIYEVVDNSFTTTIRAENIGTSGSTVLVIGIDSGSAESCILSIERLGDPEWSAEDVPYEVYQPRSPLNPYTLPAGANLREFDLTASTDTYTLVLNAEDGFYHLNTADGPLVLVQLGVDNKYISCYKAIMEKTGVRKYFYDENGEFLRREDYYDCLAQYIGKVDANGNEMYPGVMDKAAGVYPLTEDLKYIIQNHGDYNGWWDLSSETSIFQDNAGEPIPGINAEIAWLFMCVYIAP